MGLLIKHLWIVFRPGHFRVGLMVLAIAALSGCSKKKTLTQTELRSDLLSAHSYASEIEMFIDYIRHGSSTTRFAKIHAAQLAREIEANEKDLNRATPQPGTQPAAQACRAEFEFLRRELRLIPTLIGNGGALQSERAKIAESSQRLVEASSSL